MVRELFEFRGGARIVRERAVCQMSSPSVKFQMSNDYVDPCDMMNNFCFYVYAQNELVIANKSSDTLTLITRILRALE